MTAKKNIPKEEKSRWLDRVPLAAKQSLGEEIANSITHGTGVGLSVAALVILLVLAARRGDAWKIVSLSVYGATLITLYLASTLYHAIPKPGWKRFFRVLDHCSIFLLIAGTYTPVTIGVMRGPWGWTLFGVIWALAVIGINLKIFALDRRKKLSVAIYLLMGWMILIAIKPLLNSLEPTSLRWLFIGGACYTLGIVFFVLKMLPYHHSVWHLFVLAGSVCHFFAMLSLVA